MKKIILAVFFAAILLSLTGCSYSPGCCVIVPPKPVITGEKTVIENQIVGEYRELEKDAWTVSSVKTTTGRKNASGRMTGDPELFKYMKVREFHNRKIRGYKGEGALGEENTGYIRYMETKKYESSPAEKKLLMTVIEEENRARKGIFSRSIYLSKGSEPDKGELESFAKGFAEEQRGLAAKDEWIQENSGTWVRKK